MSQTNEAATAPRAKSVFFATPACLATGAELARLLEVGRWAEQEGYRSIWVTEDLAPGGHPGGGAALAAALVQVTSRIQVRAVVALPHHPIRVAEEWSMLDNLSRGRTGVCLALPRSGSPAARNELLESARAARSLFAGGGETFVDGMGNSTTIHTFPRPTSSRLSLSVWCEDREDLALASRLEAPPVLSLLGVDLDAWRPRLEAHRETFGRGVTQAPVPGVAVVDLRGLSKDAVEARLSLLNASGPEELAFVVDGAGLPVPG